MSEFQVNNLIALCFVGTGYHGSQIQENALTIQEVFQNALSVILGYVPDIKCCSRTDSGVHAKKFYISFFTEHSYSSDKLIRALNQNLPKDVRVVSHREVPEDFHARYSSKGKRYEYHVWNSRIMNPFLNDRAYQFVYDIDVDKLNDTASLFLGTHDFSSFCNIKSSVDDKVRTVYSCGVQRYEDLVVLHFQADGFLYNMARIMSGALLSVAGGKLKSDDIIQYLNGRERDNKLITLPACGLYLTEVYYDFE